MLFDIEKYVYSESVFSIIYIEIKHKCKKVPSDKINSTHNTLCFLS